MFLYEDEFDPRPGQVRELTSWLRDHDEKLRLACPDGVVYLGAFAVVHTTEREVPNVRIDWGMDSRAAMDAFEAATDEPGPLRQLLEELHGFAEGASRWHAPGRTLLASLSAT